MDEGLGLVSETNPTAIVTIAPQFVEPVEKGMSNTEYLSDKDLGLVSEINLVEKEADPENWKQISTYIGMGVTGHIDA